MTREPAGAFLDLENLFHWRHFEVDHEYADALVDPLAEEAPAEDPDPGAYPLLQQALGRHPGLAAVPKYVDRLVSWFARSYELELRRTFGKTWDPGVLASRERFRDHDFGFTPADNTPDAADARLLTALRDAAKAGRYPVFVVGSSDAKHENGIIVRALELVDLARRIRPDGSRLVVVLGPRYSSPGHLRWTRADDLGRTDEVYLLSRIVHNESRHRRTRPFRTPLADLPLPPATSRPTRNRWGEKVARWKADPEDANVTREMRASFAGPGTRAALVRSFDNFDRSLRRGASRDRLRTLAGAVVNELLEAVPRPRVDDVEPVDPAIATFPRRAG